MTIDIKLSPLDKRKLKRDSFYLYEEIRGALVKHNFVLNRIAEEIEKLVKSGDKSEEVKTNVMANQDKYKKLTHVLISQFIFGGKNLLKKPNDVILIENGEEKMINSPGIYIRYHPNMTKQGWIARFQQIKKFEKYLYLFIQPDNKVLQTPKQRFQVGYKDIKQNIDTYLTIENKIPEYWDNRKSIIDFVYEVQHDVPESGVSVIDRIIEELIYSDEKSDTELSRLAKQFKNIYYSVAERYQLPTLRDLPSFLQAINEIAS